MPRSPRRLVSLLVTLGVGVACLASVNSPAHAFSKATYRVTATTSISSVTLGSTSKVSGSVTPKAAGQTVVLQELRRNEWTSVASKKLSKTSTYRMVLNPSKVGNVKFRVCKAAYKKIKAGCSAEVIVQVSQWRYLYDMDEVDYDSFDWEDPLDINGTTYKKSLSSGDTGTNFVEYNLSRKCTSLRLTGGIADLSETGAAGLLEILTDGNSRYSQTFALGQSTPITLDVSNTLRVRFEATTDSDGIEEYVGFGSPQAYCSF